MAAPTLSPDAVDHAGQAAEAVDIRINGAKLGEEWLGKLLEVQVRDNQFLPDMAVVRFHAPDSDSVKFTDFPLGGRVTIAFGAARQTSTTNVFTGEIVALEPEWRSDGALVAIRAFDKGHRLNRKRKSQTFLQVKAEDVVRKIAGAQGLGVGAIDSTTVKYDHLQQSQETDWEFCSRLARTNGFEFGVWDDKVVFRKRRKGTAALKLTWQDNLISFRPRASAIGQVSQVNVRSRDPKAKQLTTGTASSGSLSAPTTAKIWDQRSKAIGNLSGGEATVSDRVASSVSEAKAMAEAAIGRNASTFIEAEGLALGHPGIVAGATVDIQGVGDFSGNYLIAASTHVYKGATGYQSRFEIHGDRPRAFTELTKGSTTSSGGGGGTGSSSWGQSLVLAFVTNNNDPEAMGRVKVKYEALGDNIESDWARIAVPNAGAKRGFMFMPEVGDEVVVGFEHGDTRRPFVLGSLFNGQTKPDSTLLDPASSKLAKFGVISDTELLVKSKKKMTLEIKESNEADFSLDAGGEVTQKAGKNLKAEASQNIELNANSAVKIKGSGSVEIEASGQLKVKGATVSIEGSGMVEVKGGMIKLG